MAGPVAGNSVSCACTDSSQWYRQMERHSVVHSRHASDDAATHGAAHCTVQMPGHGSAHEPAFATTAPGTNMRASSAHAPATSAASRRASAPGGGMARQ